MSNSDFRIKNNYQNILKNLAEEQPVYGLSNIIFKYIALSFYLLDIFTDLCLGCSHANKKNLKYSLGTICIVFLPMIMIQMLSLIWYQREDKLKRRHWIWHCLLLGLFYRNVIYLRMSWEAFQNNDAARCVRLKIKESENAMLHLLESFTKSAPQIIFQLYIVFVTEEYNWLICISVPISLMSILLSLVSYIRAIYPILPDNGMEFIAAIVTQMLWRICSLGARTSALIALALTCHEWTFLVIVLHWLTMVLWIKQHKSQKNVKEWQMIAFICICSVVYCFDFFNLTRDKTRRRITVFYTVIILENVSCIAGYFYIYKKHWIIVAIIWSLQTLLAIAFMVFYYKYLHHSVKKDIDLNTEQLKYKVNRMDQNRSLKNPCIEEKNANKATQITSDLSNMDAVSNADPTNVQEDIDFHSILENDSYTTLNSSLTDLNKKKRRGICSTEELENMSHESNLAVLKRRGICASTELDNDEFHISINDTDNPNSSHLNICPIDLHPADDKTEIEAPSEILSTHDYENICAVNIAREPWGLRSWQGYSDIETYFHDDSTVRDRRRDTLTSIATSGSSEFSSRDSPPHVLMLKPNLPPRITHTQCSRISEQPIDDIHGGNHGNKPIEPNIFKAKPYIADQHGTFHPIMGPIKEELEESISSVSDTSRLCHESNSSVSALVATIDKIRSDSAANSPRRICSPQIPFDSFFEYKNDDINSVSPWNHQDSTIICVDDSMERRNKVDISNLTPTEFTLSQIWFLSKLRTDVPTQDDGADNKSVIKPAASDIISKSPEKKDYKTSNCRKPRRKLSLLREKFEPKLKNQKDNPTGSVESINTNICSLSNSCDELVPPKKVNNKQKHSLSLKQVMSPTRMSPFKFKK